MAPTDDMWLPNTASMVEFRRLRQEIASLMRLDECTIRPDTRLGAIVPAHRRHEILSHVLHRRRTVPYAVVPLPVRTTWCLRILELCLTIALGFMCLWQPMWLIFATVLFSVVVAKMIWDSESVAWPAGFETMHELALSQIHYCKQDADRGLWPREEVSAKVRWLIAYQMGERFCDVTEETRFVDLC